jgi:iron complex outermembrane receptor protein
VAGVIVRVAALNLETTSDPNGQYVLRDLPQGRHVVNYLRDGFIPFTCEQLIDDASRSYGRNLELKPLTGKETTAEYMREEPKYQLEEVTVLGTRAGSESPVTFTNLSQRELQAETYGQDTPLLLSELPNVSAYSEGGGGIGYSYLRMRGMPQDHVAVQVNGVPLNDAETGEVFWVDLPDLAEDLSDMQVQRGIGSSLYGAGAFGGSINMLTRTPGTGDRAMIRAEGTYGAWNTRRAMVQFQSGRIQNRYGIAGRLTRMSTDGYRDNSWAKLWSYYLSGARYTPAHTTRLIFYGGPEQTHLAYEGVNQDYLDGRITGDKERDRRYNEFQYPGEIDNFFQPHYELHDEWKLAEQWRLDNSLYLFKGDGYYDQWRPGESAEQYFYEVPANPVDILRRRNISETDGGWIPRATWEHRYGTTSIGGELRLHQAHHEGIVLWASMVPPDAGPDYHYYDYRIDKQSVSGYIHNLFDLSRRVHVLADLQVVSHHMEMRDDRVWGVRFEKSYSSANPRVGVNYLLRELNPAGTVYVSLSRAEHEPKPRDIYDAQDYYSLPFQQYDPPRFVPRSYGYDYTGPSLKPERLTDFEVGTQWQWKKYSIGVNAYSMVLHDAIVPYGLLDNLGVPKTVNAKKTLHEGVEIVTSLAPLRGFTFTGNLALTNHHFVDYEEYDYALGDTVKRDGNRIGFDPVSVANARAGYTFHGVQAGIGMRSVGKQYVDNSQNASTAVPAYTILSLDLGYRFTQVPGLSAADIRLRVNNLLDTEYESYGYNYGEARYIVGAPRAVFATVGVEL